MKEAIPILADAIAPSIEKIMQSVFQKLNSTIQNQADEIAELKKVLGDAKASNAELQKQIHVWGLEETVDVLNSTVEETPYAFTTVLYPLKTQHHALTYILLSLTCVRNNLTSTSPKMTYLGRTP